VTIDKIGIIYAIIAALFFWTNAFIQKYVTNQGFIFSQQVYFSLFVFFSACGFLWIKKKKLYELKNFYNKNNLLAISGGCLYFFATLSSTFAYSLIPGSISFTIVQLNAVRTVLIGILIFKEISRKQHRKQILLGIVFSILGIIALLYAQ
jgi:drug/metabolite transporter (DMT)-like permease